MATSKEDEIDDPRIERLMALLEESDKLLRKVLACPECHFGRQYVPLIEMSKKLGEATGRRPAAEKSSKQEPEYAQGDLFQLAPANGKALVISMIGDGRYICNQLEASDDPLVPIGGSLVIYKFDDLEHLAAAGPLVYCCNVFKVPSTIGLTPQTWGKKPPLARRK